MARIYQYDAYRAALLSIGQFLRMLVEEPSLELHCSFFWTRSEHAHGSSDSVNIVDSKIGQEKEMLRWDIGLVWPGRVEFISVWISIGIRLSLIIKDCDGSSPITELGSWVLPRSAC